MLHTLQYHFKEPNRVDKQRPVYSVDVLRLQTLRVQVVLIYFVSYYRVLVRWLKYYAWDLEVLSVLECLVDPSLDH